MRLKVNLLIILLLLSIVYIASCNKNNFKPAQSTTEYTDSMSVDGLLRTFIVELPDSFEKISMPLVFALHGGSGTAAGMETLTSFKKIARDEKFVLVYPQGIGRSWNDGRSTAANSQNIDDVKFFSLMIDQLESKYNIDSKRIFVTGISNGGFMTSRLAFELGYRFAAAAVNAASIDSGVNYGLYPLPVSMIYMHGTADPIVPFAGGHTTVGPAKRDYFLSHQQAINLWVSIDHCNPDPVVTHMPDISNDGTTVVRYDYVNGMKGTEVTDYTIENGGHTWPGGWQYLPSFLVGKTSRDINASEVIWEFFKAHPKQ